MRIAAAALIAATLLVGIPLGNRNTELRKTYGYAFPDLQNARDPEVAKSILTQWHARGADAAIGNTMQRDLLFALCYAPLLALLAAAARKPRPTRWVRLAGALAAGAAVVGGLADLAENATMLTMLGDPSLASRVTTMVLFTQMKLAGATIAALYIMLAHLDWS
ncbi:MAG TPA: hypothetical protein VF824_13075 [Thermoanaerobaculia bacterium]|jgi:hypothetical protein